MKTMRRIAVTIVIGAAVASAATAAGGAPISLKGTQTVIDEKQGTYEMHGSLVGKWNTTAFTLLYEGSGGEVAATGKELFLGCQDADGSGSCDAGEPRGTLRFTFVYWATYKPKTQKLVKGECVHPIIGGTGDFAKAKGVLHFWDRPTKSGLRTTYTGTLELAKAAALSRTASTSRSVSARPARGACGA